jgi:DegV family protein with EDD domain
MGDEVRIKQILINLLTNAIKYTKEGSVTLSISCEKTEGNGAVLTYTVSDTGIGIKKESIPYLFTTFRRVDETQNRYIEGTGLGLSIVKEFVELMGGEITVNSIYRQGSTFIVKIPHEIADEREVGDLNMETRHALNARKHYRQSFEAPDAMILAVDDNAANLLVVKKLLRDTKVQIDTADSAEEALKKTLEKPYHVIFMDHLMPGVDGIECLHRIREQTGGLNKNSRIIALTANAGTDNKTLYAKEGFDGYLLKPVTGNDLEDELIKQLPREILTLYENYEEADEDEIRFEEMRRRRFPVMITTESVFDLPRDYSKLRDIDVIPFHVITGEGDFYDGIEAESRGLLSYVSDMENSVRTEKPSEEEYERFFASGLMKANNIVHISMSNRISFGYETALRAAEAFDNVTVIDSETLSSGMGMCVMEARRLLKEGASPEEIREGIEAYKKTVHTSFIVDDTEYLTKTGLMSSTMNTICKAFLLHPVLVIKNGRMGPGRFIGGSRKKVREKYVRSVFKKAGKIDPETIFITHAGLDTEELKVIKRLIEKRIPDGNIIFQKASSAISANCGPGSFGIIFKITK